MENDPFHHLCRYNPHKECDLCEKCLEEVYGPDYDKEYYEPTDAEIEYEIEKQIAVAEAKADNL